MKFLIYPMESDIKSHAVQDELAELVVADLEARYDATPKEVEDVDTWQWDPGGMYGMSWEVFDLPLGVTVANAHVSELIHRLQRCPVRDVAGVRHVKLHGRWQCLVVTPEAREELLVGAMAIEEKASRSYSAWLAKARKK